MKKNDIIAVYAEKNNVTKKAATEVVGSVIDIIKDGILTEGVVDITGFVKLEKVYTRKQQQQEILRPVNLSPCHQSIFQRQSSVQHLREKLTNNSEVLTYEELHSR